MRIELIQRMIVRARTVNPNVVPGAIVRLLEEMATALESSELGHATAITVAKAETRARCIAALCSHCAAGEELLISGDWFGHGNEVRVYDCPARLLHRVRT